MWATASNSIPIFSDISSILSAIYALKCCYLVIQPFYLSFQSSLYIFHKQLITSTPALSRFRIKSGGTKTSYI